MRILECFASAQVFSCVNFTAFVALENNINKYNADSGGVDSGMLC